MTAGKPLIHQKTGLLSAGRIFQWNLDKSHHVEFGIQEKGGFPQSGAVRRAAATGELSSCVFCVITRDQSRLQRQDLALSWRQPAAGGSQASPERSLETLQQFNFLKSAWL